jgi:hypothetical protein
MRLLSSNYQNTSDERQNQRCDQGGVTFTRFDFKSDGLILSGIFAKPVPSYSCGTARVTLGQIRWTNGQSWIDSQALGINSVGSSVGEGLFSLPTTWTWGSPRSNSAFTGLNAHGVFGVNSFDLSPTDRDGLRGINDRDSLIKEDDFGFSIRQVGQNSDRCGDEGKFDAGLNGAGVPRADIQSKNEDIESSKSDQAGFRSKDSRITQISHVAIVSQKVDN